MVMGEVTKGAMTATCSNMDGFNQLGVSGDFNVHPYPTIGKAKETAQEFKFAGKSDTVQNVLTALFDFITEE